MWLKTDSRAAQIIIFFNKVLFKKQNVYLFISFFAILKFIMAFKQNPKENRKEPGHKFTLLAGLKGRTWLKVLSFNTFQCSVLFRKLQTTFRWFP